MRHNRWTAALLIVLAAAAYAVVGTMEYDALCVTYEEGCR